MIYKSIYNSIVQLFMYASWQQGTILEQQYIF